MDWGQLIGRGSAERVRGPGGQGEQEGCASRELVI